ncbi:hypothetical protein EDB80DRAFT_889124 [Ilyonectria destructans]|nr:hypothetical protein EDB80DRAFT_889124 [Ilyonectria destructans]
MTYSCTCLTKRTSVGIDFGVTASKVTIVRFTKCDEHPSRTNIDYIKDHRLIPSVLPIDRITQRVLKSLEASKDGQEEVRYFKLALMQPNDWPESYSDDFTAFLRMNLGVGMNDSITKVVATFFECLWGVTGIRPVAMPSPRINVVISWPQYWTESVSGTFDRFQEAVNLASENIPLLRDVTYITEHEAAGRSAFYDYRDELNPLLEAGHSFIVIDCGGMTVDAVCCQFRDPTADPHETEQEPLFESRLAGGVALDVEFKKKLVAKIEGITGKAESDFSTTVRKKIRHIIQKWNDTHKHEFRAASLLDGSESWNWRLQGKDIIMSKSDMIEIFDTITNKISEIVLNLFELSRKRGRIPKRVILTGGLSLNLRIRNTFLGTLQSRLGDNCPPVIFDVEKVRTGVSRGAALSKVLDW